MKVFVIALTAFILIQFGCKQSTQNEHSDNGKDGWLKGNTSQKFNQIAGQLIGIDITMIDTGYRYQELYWAGQDQNWDYALYQTKKIKKTITN